MFIVRGCVFAKLTQQIELLNNNIQESLTASDSKNISEILYLSAGNHCLLIK
jgi:hypothetical protein